MIFTEQEQLSRRQFHEIFCTKYLYTGSKRGALNEDTWTADTLHDILHGIYSSNLLTPQDIEAILHLGGMFDADGNLFFHYRSDTPMIKEILYAMSPYITKRAYIECKQKMGGADNNSVKNFVVRCCTNPDQGNEKVTLKDLYEHYSTWCALNFELTVSKKVFSRQLSEIGFRIKKGYIDGNSGVLYVVIKLDKEAVNTHVKSSRKAEEEKEYQLNGATTFRDDDGTGAKVLEDLVQAAARSVPEDEGREDIAASRGGSYFQHEEDVRSGAESGQSDQVGGDISGDEDDFDWGATDESVDAEDGSDAATETAATRAGEIVIPVGITTKEEAEAFVKTLPYEIRMAFKQMKITYRISSDDMEMEEFEHIVRSLGITDINVSELFRLFLLYAARIGGSHNV